MRAPLRILYAAGPGDVAGTYRHWKTGHDDPSQVNMTLSGMFYDLCLENGDRAYVVGSSRKPGFVKDEQVTVIHRPTRFESSSGLLYHFGQILTALRLIISAIGYRADVMVVVCGTCHWFPLRVLPLFGIKVVPSLHCVLWRKYRPQSRVQRWVRKLNRKFFTRTAFRILSMSKDITDQLVEMTAGRQRPVLQFLPTYKPEAFVGIGPADFGKRPFRVCFAGRVERDKGVFDLLEIARRFRDEKVDDVVFDVCGQGGAFEELKRAAEAAGVADRLLLHGYCNRPVMREMFNNAHAVIVPTTTEFVEGFNQVVSEAILAGRPVITSSVCPALYYVNSAAIEVPVDDVKAYGDAILQLRNDPDLCRTKATAGKALAPPFYALSRGWGAALREALQPLRNAPAAPLSASEAALDEDEVHPALPPTHD